MNQASNDPLRWPAPQQIVVMGVSGVGKSTVAKGLSIMLGWEYAEGDAFHPAANIAKMAAGTPLTDEDRWPWLGLIRDWMAGQIEAGRPSVITCSALRHGYRDLLREAGPQVAFCHLVAAEGLVSDRLSQRQSHFMPGSLLHSQYETLEELDPDEPGERISVEGTPEQVLRRTLEAFGLRPPSEETAR